MKKIFAAFFALVAAGFVAHMAISQHAIPQKVGPLPNGGFLLNSGWTIRPAGDQVEVGTFPMSSILSRDGKYLLVLNAGYDPPTISVIDVATKKELSKTHVADGWLGLRIDPKSDLFYVGGGTTGKVFEFALDPASGAVSAKREINAVPDLANKGNALIGDVELSRDGHYLYAGNLYGDEIAVMDVRQGKYLGSWKTGRRPYRLMVAPSGHELLVTAWGDAAIYVHDNKDGKVVTKLRVGAHPTDMLWINKPPVTDEGQPSGTFTGPPLRNGLEYEQDLRFRCHLRRSVERPGDAEYRNHPDAPVRHDTFCAGHRREGHQTLRGLFRRQRSRASRHLRLAKPCRRLHSHRLVPHCGHGFEEW